MAQYLTYEEYVGYGGTLEEPEFTLAEFKARSRIDYLTLGRVKYMQTVPEEVKMAMMAIMKVDAKYSAVAQAEGSGLVSSFNTDGYSESYGSISEQYSAANQQLEREVYRYLFGVLDDTGIPLIYKGVQ